MRAQVVFLTVFLFCWKLCQAQTPTLQKPNSIDAAANHHEIIAPQNEAPIQKSSSTVANNDSTHKNDIQATTLKTVTNAEVPKSPSDVTDLISDSMFSRAAYLLTGISVLVLLYFAWKSFSLRRRQTHIHKYGVVASREDLEMTSLGFGSEDEEDDTTHFDIGKHQRL